MLSALINDVRLSFSGGATGGLPASRPPVSPLATTPKTAPVGTPVLKVADTATELPAEVAGEPSDVLARFSFEADQAKVVDVRELRQSPKADQGLSTVEVSIEANDGLATYDLGGTLSVLPECDPDDVMKMLPVLGLTQIDLGKFITFVTAEGGDTLLKRPFPTPCTLGVALRQYCDLGRAPSKKMLSALCPKLKDEGARERISKLIANADLLKAVQSEELCLRMHEFWSLVGVTSIDLSDFLIHCSRQKAREFTIASSSKATPGVIKICVSLTSRVAADMTSMMQTLEAHGCLLPSNSLTPLSTTTRDRFFGMCSRWLTSRLRVGDVVLAKQRPSSLKLPSKDVPIMMIGAGAGVSPFRGFWEELRLGPQEAPATLFFGCRHPEQDWLFKEEMKAAGEGCKCAYKPGLAHAGGQSQPKASVGLSLHGFLTARNRSEGRICTGPREGAGQFCEALGGKDERLHLYMRLDRDG